MTEERALLRAVEALLFAADVPLRVEDLARIIGEVTGEDLVPEQIADAITALNDELSSTGRAIQVRHLGGGWRFTTTDDMAAFVRALQQGDDERRLSRSLLETLAVVAYKQPVTKPEVDFVRGVGSDYAIRALLERGLLAIVGRSDSVGRPLLYGTTEAFLDLFGLGSLAGLPAPREIEDLLADPSFNRERIRLLAELGDALPTSPPDPGPDATS